MKRNTMSLWPLLVLLLSVAWAEHAFAYYDPGVQRWMNRDPIEEKGFSLHSGQVRGKGRPISNLSNFVDNNPVNHVDLLGLKLYKCVRQGHDMKSNLHAYLWDDKQKISCGRTGGYAAWGEDAEGDDGPGTPEHTCIEIPGSEGKEKDVMDCCFRFEAHSLFFPFLNDCHNWADRCLKGHGLPAPPMNRFTDEYWANVNKVYQNARY